MRGTRSGVVLGTALSMWLLSGCMGESIDQEQGKAAPVADISAFDALLDQTWPVRLVKGSDRAPYETKTWVTLFMKRNYERALERAGAEGGLVSARMHADLAAVYRQGTLAHGNALVHTYANRGRDTDPDAVAHLVTVGHALNGRFDEARAASARMAEVQGDLLPWHAPWAAWLPEATIGGLPSLAELPTGLAQAKPGMTPSVQGLPHYRLREKIEAESFIDMGDPGALLQLAMWHEQAARTLAGEHAAQIDAYGARYRLPLEGAVAGTVDVPMELLFGSDYAVPADVAFMAEATGGAGLAAIDTYKDTSIVAAVAAASRDESGHIDTEIALDQVMAFRQAVLKRQRAAVAGTEEGHHLLFANVVRTGLLRNLSLLVEEESHAQAHHNSGVLRINAMEYAVEEAGCPAGLMSLAAWDAGNGNPLRATEITHQQIKFYPSLETARYGLGVLASRVSFDGVGMPAN